MTWWMWLLAINGYIGMIFATYIVLKKTKFCKGDEGFFAFIWPVFLAVMIVLDLPIRLFTEAFSKIDEAIEASKEKAEKEEAEAELWEQKQEAEIRDLREEVMKLKAKSLAALDYKIKLEKSYGIKPLDEHAWTTYAQHACQELDKVSVVRCKDCAYCLAVAGDDGGKVLKCGGRFPKYSCNVGENDFCSRGRRK